uniref:Macaca fascicularis brain cDNA, clone: QorA-13922 n=1 Tax=Macaca fascicularis TaxID=9541 RepID=I7GLI6_MACFA|nr:unnamed protein product [Macaca fascicularis]
MLSISFLSALPFGGDLKVFVITVALWISHGTFSSYFLLKHILPFLGAPLDVLAETSPGVLPHSPAGVCHLGHRVPHPASLSSPSGGVDDSPASWGS